MEAIPEDLGFYSNGRSRCDRLVDCLDSEQILQTLFARNFGSLIFQNTLREVVQLRGELILPLELDPADFSASI